MNTDQIRQRYLDFFAAKGHAVIPRANLVPQDDPTTLFTGSGMQPLIPYLLGQKHPAGTKLVDSQTCFRADDIEEVGDNRHTTFFEMLGNWSLGEYFKPEQLTYIFEFLTDVAGIDPEKLYVTVFAGEEKYGIPRDGEAVEIWQGLFKQKNVSVEVVALITEQAGYDKGMQGGRIFYYDSAKNWWTRSGLPDQMPVGEPGGPSSEIFYEFSEVEHDPRFGKYCHPNCDCGRFIEIGNNVFMTYRKNAQGGFDELSQKNVDFGGGLERIAAAAIDSPDVFQISVLRPIIDKLEAISGKSYSEHVEAQRIIADHLRATVFMACDGVMPSNTAQGYVLRRLLRRAIRRGHELGIENGLFRDVAPVVADLYREAYPEVIKNETTVIGVLEHEEKVFRQTLKKGLREFDRLTVFHRIVASGAGEVGSAYPQALTGELIFRLFDTYGFPPELSLEEANNRQVPIDDGWQAEFDRLMAEQKERSRTASKGMFKGGLAEHSEQTIKYHTATHLMYKALRMVLGEHVEQRGSNITGERLRFDFNHPSKLTPAEIKQVEDIVNEQIDKDLPVTWKEMETEEALATGARGHFGEKYGPTVKVYIVGPADHPYTMELCGGPHVEHTGVLGEDGKRFKITKEESSGAGIRRIKAVLA